MVEDGYEFFAKRQLVTLFSAPNYCGEFDNAGAMMSVDETLMCSFQVNTAHVYIAGSSNDYLALPSSQLVLGTRPLVNRVARMCLVCRHNFWMVFDWNFCRGFIENTNCTVKQPGEEMNVEKSHKGACMSFFPSLRGLPEV